MLRRRVTLLLALTVCAGSLAAQVRAPKRLMTLKKGNALAVVDFLIEGQTMASANGRWSLSMFANGSACFSEGVPITDNYVGADLWCSPADRTSGQHFIYMQDNGNLCTYRGRPTANGGQVWCWAPKAPGKSMTYKTVVHDDGYLGVFAHWPFTASEYQTSPLWASGTAKIGLKYKLQVCFTLSQPTIPRIRGQIWWAENGASKSFDGQSQAYGGGTPCATLPVNSTNITVQVDAQGDGRVMQNACKFVVPRLLLDDSTTAPQQMYVDVANNPNCGLTINGTTAIYLPMHIQR